MIIMKYIAQIILSIPTKPLNKFLMFIIENYVVAVIFCIITMLCWGSWANTQKLAGKTWRFELFYWDYVIGILLFSIISAFTLGSFGDEGRPFVQDIKQADSSNISSAFLGGIIFNAANILIVAAISIAGMAVAFPVGIGIALILGVMINFITAAKGNPSLIFTGVILVAIAIVLNAIAYNKNNKAQKTVSKKGILLAIGGGRNDVFFLSFYCRQHGHGKFSSTCCWQNDSLHSRIYFFHWNFYQQFFIQHDAYQETIFG